MVYRIDVAMLPGNIRHRPRPGGYHPEVVSREVRSMFLSSYIGLAFATVAWSRSMIWIAVDDEEQPD
jgi:hypothetical protein